MSKPDSLSDALDQDAPEHYYRVFVQGYVFVKLPAGTPEEQVLRKAREMGEDGYIDITNETIDEEWDE